MRACALLGRIRRAVAGGAAAVMVLSLLTTLTLAAASPAVADDTVVVSKPDAVSAQLAAVAQGSRVEVLGVRTESSSTFANPDSTFTVETSAGPVRVPTEDGGWQPVSTDLIATDDGFAPEAAPADFQFSDGGQGDAAGIDNGKKTLTLGWPTELSNPKVDGSRASYDLGDGATLELTAHAEGYEVSVVLDHEPTTQPSWHIPLGGSQLTAVVGDDGGIALRNASGRTMFTIAPARMWDAQLDAADDPVHEGPVSMTLAGSGADQELVVAPSMDFLTADDTVYPVTVDPTTSVARQSDTYVTTAEAGTTHAADYRLRVGSPDGTVKQRGLVNFTVGMNGKHILKSTLTLRQYYAATCTAKTTYAHPISDVWTGTTWNNQPAVDTSTTYRGSVTSNYGATGCAGADVNIDVTAMTAAWASDALAEHGIELRASSETDANGEKRFCSMDPDSTLTHCDTTATEPTLSVTYNSYPAKPTTPSTNPPTACVTGSGRPFVKTVNPTLKALVSDVDGGKLRGSLLVSVVGGSAVGPESLSSLVSSGSNAQWTVANGYLTNGSSYSWKVRGYNSGTESGVSYTDYSTSYSTTCEFTVDTTLPSAPTVSSSTYPSGQWNSGTPAGTFTFAASDTAPGSVDHYLWSLDNPTPSTPTASGSASATIDPMPGGWHTLRAAAVDKAGNVSAYTAYSFGAGVALTSPTAGTVTNHSVVLSSRTANGPTTVTYYARRAATDPWVPIPVGDITGGAVSAWPLSFSGGSGDAIPPSLTWNAQSTLGSNGPGQVAACFGATCPTGSTSTLPSTSSGATNILLDSTMFNVAATTDITPGSVNLLTGNFQFSAGDVSVPGNQDNALSIGRTLNTATVAATDGIFGPGWTASLPVDTAGVDYTGLSDTGSIVTASYSDQTTTPFAVTATAGKYLPVGPDADTGLVLKTETAASGCSPTSDYRRCYRLTDLDGNTVIFQSVDGGTSGTLPPVSGSLASPVAYRVLSVTEPGAADTTTFSYSGGRVSRILSPLPSGSPTCTNPAGTASTWSPGCRALDLSYDSNGHLTAVTYDTSDGTNPLQVDVACYTYSATAPYRLTDTWDPRDIATAGTGTHPISCGSAVRPTHYDYDGSGRLSKVTPAYSASSPALAGWTMAYDANGRLSTVSRAHLDASGSEVTSVLYGVDITPDTGHADYRPDLTATTAATWAQTDLPDGSVGGTAVCPPGATITNNAGDLRDCTLTYLDGNGRAVNSADYAGTGATGWHLTTTEYDTLGHTVRDLSASNREEALSATTAGSAPQQLGLPADTAYAAMALSSVSVYTPNSRDDLPDLTETYGPYHQVQLPDDTIRAARARAAAVYDNSTGDTDPETGHPVDVNGQPTSLHLPVKTTTAASLSPDATPVGLTDTRTTLTRYYLGSDGTGWTFGSPMQTIIDPNGLTVTNTTLYDATSGLVTYARTPAAVGDNSNSTAGTTKYLYYAAGTGSGDSDCNNHPLWDGMPCKTLPADLSPTAGLPSLVTTWFKAYDYLGRTVETVESATPSGGSPVTRTTVSRFGFNSTITSGVSANPYSNTVRQTSLTGGTGTAVPDQTFTYATATALPTATSNGTVADSSSYDDFGRTVSYTENTSATGGQANTATATYSPTRGWVTQTTDAHTTTTYSYNSSTEHRGLPTALAYTVGGTSIGNFTGTYDADGALANQTDPNSVTMGLTRDEIGQLVDLVDTKSGNGWLSDDRTVSIYGQVLHHSGAAGEQTYGVSEHSYVYDAVGRLTQATDKPAAGTCAIRMYAFTGNAGLNSNRTASTAYPSLDDGGCQTSAPYTGGVTLTHGYDTADRLQAANGDTGLTYDTYGRTLVLPAADTQNGQDATVGYYTSDLVRTLTQGTGANQTVQTLSLDANRRLARTTVSLGGTTTADRTNHYDDAATDSPYWTAENITGTTWTANLTDLTGNLAATITSASVIAFQYANLHGDVNATAAPADSIPTVAPDYDEYGNNPPVAGIDSNGNPTSTPASNPRYGWLGAKQRPADNPAGIILMGVRLYAPALGRFLQTDPIPGGSANNYDYSAQDPINNTDLDGRLYQSEGSGWLCGAASNGLTSCLDNSDIKQYIGGVRWHSILHAVEGTVTIAALLECPPCDFVLAVDAAAHAANDVRQGKFVGAVSAAISVTIFLKYRKAIHLARRFRRLGRASRARMWQRRARTLRRLDKAKDITELVRAAL